IDIPRDERQTGKHKNAPPFEVDYRKRGRKEIVAISRPPLFRRDGFQFAQIRFFRGLDIMADLRRNLYTSAFFCLFFGLPGNCRSPWHAWSTVPFYLPA